MMLELFTRAVRGFVGGLLFLGAIIGLLMIFAGPVRLAFLFLPDGWNLAVSCAWLFACVGAAFNVMND